MARGPRRASLPILGTTTPRVAQNPGTVTLHDFSGGWNAFENDLNMSPKYSVRERNVYRGDDGAKTVRFGTALFADFAVAGYNEIVNGIYYSGSIVAVNADGTVLAADKAGTVVVLFNNQIASQQAGAPSGWGPTNFVCFSQFAGKLGIFNGIDKPLQVDTDFVCQYGSDPVDKNNAHVPRAKLAVGGTDYHVLALDSTISITNKASMWTFTGNSAPNDAIDINLAPRVRQGATEIRGLAIYRDRLVVAFDECILPLVLGIYDSGGVHTPTFDQPFDGIGTISHRSMISMGDSLRICDITGVTDITQSRFVSLLNIGTESTLVNPPLRNDLSLLDPDIRDRHVFAVRNKLEAQYMLFVPLDNSPLSRVRGYVFSENPDVSIKAWAEFYDWRWRWGTSSPAGNVFFGRDGQVFLFGNRQNPVYSDYVGEQETYSDGTSHTDLTGWTPIVSYATSGVPIKFDWIQPWNPLGRRMNEKNSRYLSFDTQGTAKFTVRMYVDNFFLDRSDVGEPWTDNTLFTDGTGWIRVDPLTTPSNEMDFVGGDNLGYGGDPYGELYGGGRIAQDERLWSWTAKFKIAKFRISGYALSPLKIVSISVAYNMGSIRR